MTQKEKTVYLTSLSRFFSFRLFPVSVQILMLLVFLALIVLGWQVTTDDDHFAKILRNTNISNLVVWSYWWPLVIISAIVFGRVWCMVCPMELLSFGACRIGLNRSVPRWMKSGWVITLFYAAVLLIGIHTLNAHRLPHRMAWYLVVLLGSAILTSLVFEKRAFCSYVCPVGHLLGVYAMLSPLRWGVRDTAICRDCKSKDCIATGNQGKLIGRSCTSGLYPAENKANRACLLCTQCAKSCPNNNPGLVLQKPLNAFYSPNLLNAAQISFMLLVAGFVVYEILSEFKPSKAILTWIPTWFNGWAGWYGSAAALSSAVIMFVVFPAVFMAMFYGVKRLIGTSDGGAFVSMLTFLLVPTMAAAHIIKGLVKMNTRLEYFPHVFGDLRGVQTATKIQSGEIVVESSIAASLESAISWIAAGLLVTALIYSVHVLFKSAMSRPFGKRIKMLSLVAVLFYWAVFAATIYAWRF